MAKKRDTTRPLSGKVAIVTGASRGIGKGIALGLGEAGAIVYLTGRTLKKGDTTIPLSGSLTETARAVSRSGGEGIACQCDHRKDHQGKSVFQRVREEQGKLDILVNNAWSGYEHLHHEQYYSGSFWELPIKLWDSMHEVGTRSSYVASVYGAPLMIEQRSGLIVNISFYAAAQYFNQVCYGVAKMAADKMAVDMAYELREHGVSSVSLWPGLVRTEGVMRGREKEKLPHSESPQFVGRAVAALAADPKILEKSGQILIAAELARKYGFRDIDDSRPQPLHKSGTGRYRNLREGKWEEVRQAMSLSQK